MDDRTIVDSRPLFRPLAAELLHVLAGLDETGWDAPTSAGEWRVRDVVAHLIDGDLRRLSIQRDRHAMPDAPTIEGYADLVRYLNELNGTWITAARRLSRQVLLDLIEESTTQLADLMEATDLDAPALFPVVWAGESVSRMWLDIGREYTERWHHQDQIRDAVGVAPLSDECWLKPVIDISLMAVPARYASIGAPAGTTVGLTVNGGGGGEWTLKRQGEWILSAGRENANTAEVVVADLEFARLLLHRLSPDRIAEVVRVNGAADLAQPLLQTRAVMV